MTDNHMIDRHIGKGRHRVRKTRSRRKIDGFLATSSCCTGLTDDDGGIGGFFMSTFFSYILKKCACGYVIVNM